MIFLYLLVWQERVWAVGIVLMLTGIVTGGFAYFQPNDAAQGGDDLRNGGV